MAKHCTICNQAYPDDQAACPHCGAAAETIRPVAPGSSPDIILGDQSMAEASDSDLVPVITNEGSSATHFDRAEGSSMDIDLGQVGPGDSSALIVAAADQGSPSDVMDVDFSSVADSSSSHPPLVAEPSTQSSATAEPNAGTSDDASGLTVGEPEALAGFGSGSSLEIEAVAPPESAPAAAASDPSADIVGHEDMAALAETADSSAVDLGSYREENADAETAAAGASSSWDRLKESGELVEAGTAVPADEIVPQERASRGWMGAGAVGLLAGAAASVALWTFGVEPPQALRGLVGKKKPTVAQTQPVSSRQPAQRTPEQPPAAVIQPAPSTPAKKTDDEALAKVASALRGDADVQKQDPQLKKVDQDVQLVMQGKKQARAELDAVRKAVADIGGQAKVPASLADAVTRAMQKAKTVENQLAAVGRAVGLNSANEPVGPAVEKLLADRQAAKKQLASIAHQAAADKALIQAAVQRLTAAKLLPNGAGADKLLASMDQLLTAGPSPVATALGGVATGLGEVSGAATRGAGSVVNATGYLAVNGLHNTLAALSQPHRPGVVTTTVLHQPAEDNATLQLPQSLGTYQPEAAVKHFSAGYQSYWSGDPDQAVREFQAAIQNDRDDARYCYFLGLTLLQQSRQAAAVRAIRKGALLEKQGLPDTSAVNLALERVQGPMRELLDQYRR